MRPRRICRAGLYRYPRTEPEFADYSHRVDPEVPLEHDLVTPLNDEFMRIEVREKVQDHHLARPAKELLERLRKVPSGDGAQGVRSELS